VLRFLAMVQFRTRFVIGGGYRALLSLSLAVPPSAAKINGPGLNHRSGGRCCGSFPGTDLRHGRRSHVIRLRPLPHVLDEGICPTNSKSSNNHSTNEWTLGLRFPARRFEFMRGIFVFVAAVTVPSAFAFRGEDKLSCRIAAPDAVAVFRLDGMSLSRNPLRSDRTSNDALRRVSAASWRRLLHDFQGGISNTSTKSSTSVAPTNGRWVCGFC